MPTNARKYRATAFEDFADDAAPGSLFGPDRFTGDGPAVVIDHVSMVYNVTSTGGGDEVPVPAPVRWARKALGRPPVEVTL